MGKLLAGLRASPSGLSFVTGGVDVGSTAIKTVLCAHSFRGDQVIAVDVTLVGARRQPIDYRNALRASWACVLDLAGVSDLDVAYVASTGVRDQIAFRVGHFFGRLSNGVGAQFLFPQAIGYLDGGARQMRGALVDATGRVVRHLSRRPTSDPALSAVAGVSLLTALNAEGAVVLVGGRTRDPATLALIRDRAARQQPGVRLVTSPDALFAGAFGAALLAARRYKKLAGGLVGPGLLRGAAAANRCN